jgi:hypothetical protein
MIDKDVKGYIRMYNLDNLDNCHFRKLLLSGYIYFQHNHPKCEEGDKPDPRAFVVCLLEFLGSRHLCSLAAQLQLSSPCCLHQNVDCVFPFPVFRHSEMAQMQWPILYKSASQTCSTS